MDTDEKRMEPRSLKRHWTGAPMARVGGGGWGLGGWGGVTTVVGACCWDTGRIQSRVPAVLLDNTFDPVLTPNWPLTRVVTPNQCSHAQTNRGNGRRLLPAGRNTGWPAAARINIIHSDICNCLKSHFVQSLPDRLSSTWREASEKCVLCGSLLREGTF